MYLVNYIRIYKCYNLTEVRLLNVGAKIKNLRLQLGMNQEEFGKFLHRATVTIKKYESNKGITIDLLEHICKLTNTNMAYFLCDSDDLYKIFIDTYNLNNLSPKNQQKLEIEFKVLIDFLLHKYTEN